MPTITIRLSNRLDKITGKREVLLRFRHGHFDRYAKTHLFLPEKYFNEGKIKINYRIRAKEVLEALDVKKKVNSIIDAALNSFSCNDPATLSRKWLQDLSDQIVFPVLNQELIKDNSLSLQELLDKFFYIKTLSEKRKRHYMVLYRLIRRYELYFCCSFDIDNVTPKALKDLENFIREEHTFFVIDKKTGLKKPNVRYRRVFEAYPETRIPAVRGDNRVCGIFKMLRALFKWANQQGYTSNDPFQRFSIVRENYGRPILLSIEERDLIYHHDFSSNQQMERQRDVFIFQCLTGCRISDLYDLTSSNIIRNDKGIRFVHYIPKKTMRESLDVVKVPLTDMAEAILDKYKGYVDEGKILPLISQPKYNGYIHEIIKESGIDRAVIVRNPTTGLAEQKMLSEVATSHLARRTFAGNLYKKVKDPNLVGKLSGHKEGSRAFARYRDIDDDMIAEMKDLI